MAEVDRSRFVVTPWFRGSFIQLDKEYSYEGSRPARSLTALWYPSEFDEPEKDRWENIGKVCDTVCREAPPNGFGKTLNELLKNRNFKFPIRDGSEKSDRFEGYEGSKFAAIRSYGIPKVIWPDKSEFDLGIASMYAKHCYAGRWFRAVMRIGHFSNVGIGIGFYLDTLQLGRDDEPFTAFNGGQADDMLEQYDYKPQDGGGNAAGAILDAAEGSEGGGNQSAEDLGF